MEFQNVNVKSAECFELWWKMPEVIASGNNAQLVLFKAVVGGHNKAYGKTKHASKSIAKYKYHVVPASIRELFTQCSLND